MTSTPLPVGAARADGAAETSEINKNVELIRPNSRAESHPFRKSREKDGALPYKNGVPRATDGVPKCWWAGPLRIHLTSGHHLLRLLVEGHLLPGLDCRHIHAQRNAVAIAGFNRSIRRLAAAHALHPVAHVGAGHRI